MTNSVAGAASDQVGDDVEKKVGELMDRLKTENLAPRGKVVLEMTAKGRVLLGNVYSET